MLNLWQTFMSGNGQDPLPVTLGGTSLTHLMRGTLQHRMDRGLTISKYRIGSFEYASHLPRPTNETKKTILQTSPRLWSVFVSSTLKSISKVAISLKDTEKFQYTSGYLWPSDTVKSPKSEWGGGVSKKRQNYQIYLVGFECVVKYIEAWLQLFTSYRAL